jgi:UDP-2,3-diacylglucosamine hydrolase
MSAVSPVGLIAGGGRFPIYFAERAKEVGLPVCCVGIAGMADPVLQELCPSFTWLRRAAIGKIIRTFQRNGVKRWTMAGKIYKHVLFRPWRILQFLPDWRTIHLWYFRLRGNHGDDRVLLGIIDEFASEGLECVSALDLCPELLVRPGLLTRRSLSTRETEDVQFGWDIAKQMGQLDIGQSVMVREGVVLAVEAIEGTDQAILRAGQLCPQQGFVVIKVAKPQQDRRFDVPTIGPATIETMKKAGASVLAVETQQTILIDEAETIKLADRYGISIIAR